MLNTQYITIKWVEESTFTIGFMWLAIYLTHNQHSLHQKLQKFGASFELFPTGGWWVFIEWIGTIIDYNPIVKIFIRGGRVLLCSAGVSGSN